MLRIALTAAIVTYVLAVVQVTLGARLAVWGVSPDLLLLWTICAGLLGVPQAGALVGFGSGVLQGALVQSQLGAYAISKILAGTAAGLLGRRVFRDNWLVPSLAAAVLTVLHEVLFVLLSRVEASSALRVIGLRVLYHAALAPFCYALVARAQRARRLARGPVR
jgi:rod shape-determining protein MreD